MNKFEHFKKIFLAKLFFSLRTKMLLSFSILIILSVTFMAFFSVYKYGETLQKNNIKYSNQVMGNLIRNLNDYISEIEGITTLAIYNLNIQTYLIGQSLKVPLKNDTSGNFDKTVNSQSFVTSMDLLGNLIYTRKDISSILIFNNADLALFKSSNLDIDTSFDFKKEPWYIKTLTAGKKPILTDPHMQSYVTKGKENVLSVSRLIEGYNGLGNVGMILVDTNSQVIKDLCSSVELIGSGYIFIVNKAGNIVYTPDNDVMINQTSLVSQNEFYKNVLPKLLNQNDGSFIAEINNEKQQLVFKHMDKTDWTIVAVTPYKDMTSDAQSIRTIIIFAGFICFFVIIAIVQFLSTRFTKPVLALARIMNQADNGNLNIRAHIHTNDEISTLSHSFNNMLERIDSLMKQVVAEQDEKRKSDLNVLKSQINPHFLYNTLDSIVWMIASNNKNAIKMIEALSRFFRISLSRGQDLITLSDELEHVKNYLIIQGMRYLNKIDFKITADESILNYKTLNIILQPLVENSIYHGIKNKNEKGFINISAYEEDNKLIITVEDDGVGMDEETCRDILKESFEQKFTSGSGIGVRNVNSRIKLYFGSQYGLSFKSTLGVGTTAFINLPLIK